MMLRGLALMMDGVGRVMLFQCGQQGLYVAIVPQFAEAAGGIVRALAIHRKVIWPSCQRLTLHV